MFHLVVEGWFLEPFRGSVNPELARVFSELIIQGGEELCGVAAF